MWLSRELKVLLPLRIATQWCHCHYWVMTQRVIDTAESMYVDTAESTFQT
jgi:hypothetical protein